MSAADHDKCGGSFEDFEVKYGIAVASDTLQRVCEAAYTERGYKKHDCPGVTIGSIHGHDAINMTFTGTVLMPDGIEYGFIIEDGNWNGTVVQEWGLAEHVGTYEPPKPNPYRLFPRHAATLRVERPALWAVYLAWRRETWFTDLERGYNYDRHFSPGVVTDGHYTGPSSVATKRGLIWKLESDVEDFIARPDSDFEWLRPVVELAGALTENPA